MSTLVELQAELSLLREEVERLRAQRRITMRDTHRCPSCNATRIFHFPMVTDMSEGGPVPMSLHKEYSFFRGLHVQAGQLEAFVCTSCLLVEWHVLSLDGVKPDGKTIRELDGTARPETPSGPYR